MSTPAQLADGSFKINDTAIPTPTTYEWSREDLSSEATGRTLDGVMHKDVVAAKDTYSCTWKKLSWSDAATLLNAIDEKSKVQFTYLDPRVPNQWVTGQFYVGQRTAVALNVKDPARTWSNIAFKFIMV